jgi:ketosteroid isomerase-like protein
VSQENVEVAKALTDAFNAGDMDTYGGLLAQDVIWRVTPDWPEPGPYVGRDAVLRQVRQLRETAEDNTVEPISDFLHTGDRVAVRFVWRGRGHGPDFNIEMTSLYTIRQGKILAVEFFWIHEEVLAAMGLEE